MRGTNTATVRTGRGTVQTMRIGSQTDAARHVAHGTHGRACTATLFRNGCKRQGPSVAAHAVPLGQACSPGSGRRCNEENTDKNPRATYKMMNSARPRNENKKPQFRCRRGWRFSIRISAQHNTKPKNLGTHARAMHEGATTGVRGKQGKKNPRHIRKTVDSQRRPGSGRRPTRHRQREA